MTKNKPTKKPQASSRPQATSVTAGTSNNELVPHTNGGSPADINTDGNNDFPVPATAASTQSQNETDGTELMDVDETNSPTVTKTPAPFNLQDGNPVSDEEFIANMDIQIQQEKLNIKQVTRHMMILQTRVLKQHGVKDDKLQLELAAIKERLATDEENLAHLEDTYSKFASLIRPNQIDHFISDTDSIISTATSQSSDPNHRRRLPVKLQPHWPRLDNTRKYTPYSFFDAFRRQVLPELGDDIFRDFGHVYLTLLVNNNDFQDQLEAAFRKLHPTVITLDIMEQTFLDICMTKEQREKSVEDITKIGRYEGESYRHFASRILQTVKQHRIEDDNSIILTILRQIIPYRDMDTVNTRFHDIFRIRTPN
ncbi:hypothetical protein BGZ52_006156, partial [Haplosporangium bisporale]